MTKTNECAHSPCHCEVALDQTYCCDDCSIAAAVGQEVVQCGCGHTGCA